MNLVHGLFEIEILVFLLRCDANASAGGEAPIVRLKFLERDELYQPLDITQLGVRESFLKPMGMPREIADQVQLSGSGGASLGHDDCWPSPP